MIEFLIITFIVTMATGLQAEKASATDFEVYAHVGGQANTSDAPMGGIGIIYKNKIDLNITFIGEGETKWDTTHESMRVVSISRIVTPGWLKDRFFVGLGYANVQYTILVGEHNFQAMVGLQYDWGRLYLIHQSDFDIGTNDNTGLDGAHISLNLAF